MFVAKGASWESLVTIIFHVSFLLLQVWRDFSVFPWLAYGANLFHQNGGETYFEINNFSRGSHLHLWLSTLDGSRKDVCSGNHLGRRSLRKLTRIHGHNVTHLLSCPSHGSHCSWKHSLTHPSFLFFPHLSIRKYPNVYSASGEGSHVCPFLLTLDLRILSQHSVPCSPNPLLHAGP